MSSNSTSLPKLEILSKHARTIDKLEWQNKALLIPHEPIRRDLRFMCKAMTLENIPHSQRWKLPLFFSWYKQYFNNHVHHHHDVEEELFFPWVASRVTLPDKYSDDHIVQLMNHLNRIVELEDLFRDSSNSGSNVENDKAAHARAMSALQKAVKTLNDFMCEHLDEEEEQIPELMSQHFTEKEHDEMVENIMKSLGLSTTATMLPWILDAMKHWDGPEAVDNFVKNLPFPIRMMLRYRWMGGSFEKHDRTALNALMLRQDEPPKHKGWLSTLTFGLL